MVLVYLSCHGLVDLRRRLYFAASDGAHGTELWKSDGTEAGTVMVEDIVPGPGSSIPSRLANVNGTLYFVADDGVSGAELWKSDGTEAGTVLVADIAPGATTSDPFVLANLNGALFLSADDGTTGLMRRGFSRDRRVRIAALDRGPQNRQSVDPPAAVEMHGKPCKTGLGGLSGLLVVERPSPRPDLAGQVCG